MNSFHVDHSRLLLHSLLPPPPSPPVRFFSSPRRPGALSLSRSISFSSFSRFHYTLNKQLIRVHKDRDSSFFFRPTRTSGPIVARGRCMALPPALINRIVVIRRSPTFVPVSAILKPQLVAATGQWMEPRCAFAELHSDMSPTDRRLRWQASTVLPQCSCMVRVTEFIRTLCYISGPKNAQDTSTLSKCRDFAPNIEYFVYGCIICDS